MAVVTSFVGVKMYALFSLFYPASPFFQPYQVITHMFMHGGWLHLFLNMFALFMFGSDLERVWGPKRYLFYYLMTGFGAVALHLLVQAIIVFNVTGTFNPDLAIVASEPLLKDLYQQPSVGASGAIFGVLVAFGMLFPTREIMLLLFPVPIQARYFVGFYVLAELFMGLNVNDNVGHFAHLGGALIGFIIVKIWNRNRDFLF